MTSPTVSVVLPTYRRAAALEVNFGSLVALAGVDEILVVLDGPDPEAAAVLESFREPRVRVITRAERGGSQAARNTGIEAARGDWLLMADDDLQLPPDYVTTLLAEAQRHDAHIAGAPWVFALDDDLDERLAEARATPVADITWTTPITSFPAHTTETPFLYSQVLVHRSVFETIRYDPIYRLNGWREETSMFLDATKAGFRCIMTPATYSFQVGDWSGGQRSGPFRREYWVVVNNWRFLRRHGDWLRSHGQIPGIVRAQLTFITRRYRRLLRERREERIARRRRRSARRHGELEASGA